VEHLQLLILPVLQGALDSGDKKLMDAALVERLLREVRSSHAGVSYWWEVLGPTKNALSC